MLILVTGGSASGKSEFAEKLAVSFEGELVYAATMKPWDEECRQRIKKHRIQRSGRGFKTIERYTDIGGIDASGVVLLEDLGNLAANEMFGGNTGSILNGIFELNRKCSALVIVTDNVFEDSNEYGGDTKKYIELMGRLNCSIAASADYVYEVVCGIPSLIYSKEGNEL